VKQKVKCCECGFERVIIRHNDVKFLNAPFYCEKCCKAVRPANVYYLNDDDMRKKVKVVHRKGWTE
jgi:hypothetical protein